MTDYALVICDGEGRSKVIDRGCWTLRVAGFGRSRVMSFGIVIH